MDISGLVLTTLGICFEVASTLYTYGTQVKAAKGNIQQLSNELFGLIGALEHLKAQQERDAFSDAKSPEPPAYSDVLQMRPEAKTEKGSSVKSTQLENVAGVLNQTIEFLQELLSSLQKPSNKLHSAVQLLKWPLRDNEVKQHLARLERVKTFFILSLITNEVDQSRKTADEIFAIRTMIQSATLGQCASDARKEHQAVMEWLCPVDSSTTRSTINKARVSGSCSWFIKNETFQKHSASAESSCLWLNGITGAGKSTLMTAAIDELVVSNDGAYDLAYFYCSFSNDESLYTQNVLGSILAQIASESDAFYEELRAIYLEAVKRPKPKPTRLDNETATKYIIRQARNGKPLHLVIDAINECNDTEELLKALEEILRSTSNVRLLISSIDEKGINRAINRLPKVSWVTVSPLKIKNDVILLVMNALETQVRLRSLPPKLKEEIFAKLTDGADGMFRWVQCQLDLLSKMRTPGAVQRALTSLPPTLDKTYESLLRKIDGEEDRVMANVILQLLAFSLRPLDLLEVGEALQITVGLPCLDDGKRLIDPREILDICGSLLKYNEQTGILTLAHHSVKTYLTSDLPNEVAFFKLDAQEAHRNISLICLTYLSFDCFNTSDVQPPKVVGKQHPFFNYSAFNWAIHTQQVTDINEPLWGTLRRFLLGGDQGRQNFVNWVKFLIPRSAFAEKTAPLYYAASYGLTSVVKYLISLGANLEQHGGRGGATPINIAAFRNHRDVVKILYEAGADPLKKDRSTNLNALQWAFVERSWDVLEYFEEVGYRPKVSGDRDNAVRFPPRFYTEDKNSGSHKEDQQ